MPAMQIWLTIFVSCPAPAGPIRSHFGGVGVDAPARRRSNTACVVGAAHHGEPSRSRRRPDRPTPGRRRTRRRARRTPRPARGPARPTSSCGRRGSSPAAIVASTPSSPSTTARTSSSLPTHSHHELGAVGGVGRRRRRGVVVLAHPLVGLRAGAVVDGDLVAGGGEVAGHRRPHRSQSDERDTCHRHDVAHCRRRSGASGAAGEVGVAELDEAVAAEARLVAGVDDGHRQLAQPAHRRDVGVDVGAVELVEQRPVVDARRRRTARRSAASHRPMLPGEWPGRWSTSKARSPRSTTSPSASSRVAGAGARGERRRRPARPAGTASTSRSGMS